MKYGNEYEQEGSWKPFPEDLVEKFELRKLSYWLCRLVTEVREKDDQPYPSKTIQHIPVGLQRMTFDTNPDAIKFLDSSQSVFRELQCTCNTVYHDLHSQGTGATVCHTSTFSPDDEHKLWSTRVMGCSIS